MVLSILLILLFIFFLGIFFIFIRLNKKKKSILELKIKPNGKYYQKYLKIISNKWKGNNKNEIKFFFLGIKIIERKKKEGEVQSKQLNHSTAFKCKDSLEEYYFP